MSYNDSIINVYRSRGYKIYFYEANIRKGVSFDSYLTSFTDSYQPEWQSIPAGIGQQDMFKRPTVVSRKISIGFDVPSATLNESIVNLEKMRVLARFLYPPTNGGTSISSIQGASQIYIKFLNLICDYDNGPIQAYIDEVSIAPVVENGFFDPGPSRLYPKTLKVELSFGVTTRDNDPASRLYETAETSSQQATQPPPAQTSNPPAGPPPSPSVSALINAAVSPPVEPQQSNVTKKENIFAEATKTLNFTPANDEEEFLFLTPEQNAILGG